MCSCGFEPETTDHYLLRWKLYSDLRLDLLKGVFVLNQTLKHFFDEQLVNVVVYGSGNSNPYYWIS